MDTRKGNLPYFSSRAQLVAQFSDLFKRKYRYVITSSQIAGTGKKKRPIFLYQESAIVNLISTVFNKKKLTEILKKAIEDMLIILELKVNLITFEFLATSLYYLVTKNSEESEYYMFLGHTNTDNPYIPDNVKWIKGIHNLETYIDEVLATNHFEEAKQQFADQFPDSDVVIDAVTHVVFLFQPFNHQGGIQQEIYWSSTCVDNLSNVI